MQREKCGPTLSPGQRTKSSSVFTYASNDALANFFISFPRNIVLISRSNSRNPHLSTGHSILTCTPEKNREK